MKNDFNIKYETDFRNIKYPRLEFKTGELRLILPKNYKKEKELLEKHRKWIESRYKFILEALESSKNIKIKERSNEELRKIVLKYSKNKGIRNIYFRKMKTKWASLSHNKNLTVNTLLKYLPEELIKYVIYHELTHLKQKRHNSLFWEAISSKFKDYKEKEKKLFIYWFAIQNKLKNLS